MNLLERKEQLFQEYCEVTQLALATKDSDELAAFVEKREELITQINEIDQQAGKVDYNENIKQVLKRILPLDNELREKLKHYKDEAQQQLRTVKNAQRMKNQYEQGYAVADGVFYDKRR